MITVQEISSRPGIEWRAAFGDECHAGGGQGGDLTRSRAHVMNPLTFCQSQLTEFREGLFGFGHARSPPSVVALSYACTHFSHNVNQAFGSG